MGCCCNNNNKKSRLLWFVIAAVVIGGVLFVWLNDAHGQAAAYGGATAVSDAPSVNHDHAADSHEEHSGGEEHNHAEASGGPEPLSDAHDHAAHDHADATSGLKRLIAWLGKFHPPATDFPVALLISGAIAEVLLIVTGRPLFDSAARFCVWLGSLGAVGAVMLGWFFAGFALTDGNWVMTLHRWLGTGVGALALVLLALNVAAHRPDGRGGKWLPWYRVALFTAAVAVATNGFFGGAMMYGRLDYYAW